MSSDADYDRATIDTPEKGRLRRAWDTLQDTVRQPVETVTRRASLKTVSSGAEDIDAPDAIPTFVDLYQDTGAIRKNINEFRDDVAEPGIRVDSPDDTTAAYFNGGDDAPEGAPTNGFLAECYVDDQKRQPIDEALDVAIVDRWRRGTVLLENVYGDRENEDGDPIISGCTFVRPETISARTYTNTNQLLVPNPDDPLHEGVDPKLTDRGEVAAWVQFDENAILSRVFDSDFDDEEEMVFAVRDHWVAKRLDL